MKKIIVILICISQIVLAGELQIKNNVEGSGVEIINHSKIKVHYLGKLEDGTKFDSSYDRGEPLSFQIGLRQVIEGWENGLMGMKVGGKRTLIIPPEFAYGERGAGDLIPPNATLVFDVEIIDVQPPMYSFVTMKEIKADLLDRVKEIDPFYFEKVILILLKKMGYGDFVETSKSGDGGVDGIINQDQLGLSKIYIQAKRYAENKVREKEIRNFIGAMSGDTTNGVFVTTSSFGESAIAKAKEAHHKIILIDGRKLVDLMYEFEVGVQVISNYQVKEPDDEFFEST